jgi:hypothetical protein
MYLRMKGAVVPGGDMRPMQWTSAKPSGRVRRLMLLK